MVQQSNDILKELASENPNSNCTVGSALFLGPSIRMMCGDSPDGWSYDGVFKVHYKISDTSKGKDAPYPYGEEEKDLRDKFKNFLREKRD